jgi:glutamate-ammonia-ligase adenylyltransferase
VIDELAGGDVLKQRFVAEEFEAELQARRAALMRTGEDDEENLLNLLRRAHHAEVFRTLARDVEGYLTVEQVADDLSAMADAVLRVTAQWCWSYLKNRHREAPQFAIIAYGKLGGKELGYGSDLDIVFVYEDADERAQEVYAGFVRKLINWFTVKTAEGDLFEIDTALRPNGSSGLLVTTFDAYVDYQQQRGSNTAWTWEHQAMTRARFVMGEDAMRRRFDQVRHAVIGAQRDPHLLRQEIEGMRNRVRSAHPIKFNIWCCCTPQVIPNWPTTLATLPFCSGLRWQVCCRKALGPPPPKPIGNCAAFNTKPASMKSQLKCQALI